MIGHTWATTRHAERLNSHRTLHSHNTPFHHTLWGKLLLPNTYIVYAVVDIAHFICTVVNWCGRSKPYSVCPPSECLAHHGVGEIWHFGRRRVMCALAGWLKEASNITVGAMALKEGCGIFMVGVGWHGATTDGHSSQTEQSEFLTLAEDNHKYLTICI